MIVKRNSTWKLPAVLAVAGLLAFATGHAMGQDADAEPTKHKATPTGVAAPEPTSAPAPAAKAEEPAAAPEAAAAAPAAPKLDTGDTAWMLTSSALVLMMTIPGLALFYGGLVRGKNVLS